MKFPWVEVPAFELIRLDGHLPALGHAAVWPLHARSTEMHFLLKFIKGGISGAVVPMQLLGLPWAILQERRCSRHLEYFWYRV